MQDPDDQGNLPAELVDVSRTLARLLRHDRTLVDENGWCSVKELKLLPDLFGISSQDVEIIVKESYSKSQPRFELETRHQEMYLRAAHKRTIGVFNSRDEEPRDRRELRERREPRDLWAKDSPTRAGRGVARSNLETPPARGCNPDSGQMTPPPTNMPAMPGTRDWLDPNARSPSPSKSSQAKSSPEASDPWRNGVADPWKKNRPPGREAPKARRSPIQEPLIDLMSADVQQIELAEVPVFPTPQVYDISTGDMESTASAADSEALYLNLGVVEEPQASAAEALVAAEADEVDEAPKISNLGNYWKQYLHEDSSKGTWWWCETTEAMFEDSSPEPWVQYEDPEGRPYWCNEETEEFFYL